MRVWVAVEHRMRDLAEIRYVCRWWKLIRKLQPNEECDFDRDLQENERYFATEGAARKHASKVRCFFDDPQVAKQRLQLLDYGDRIAEWEDE